MSEESDAIIKARELLQTTRHAAMATVNNDGTPHNTPFFFIYSPQFTKIYWGSHTKSQHSQNILRTGQVFIVIYDSKYAKLGGLYIQAEKGHILEGDELEEGLRIHNQFREKEGKKPLEKSYYTGNSPQKMWSVDIAHIWILQEQRDENGRIIEETRKEMTAKELLNN